ncbi:MAG: altronate dehydratase [Ruminococcaceae bacterium]|nr:altronate dehydratase [Oscillospiraceae bacterium]
MNKAIKLNAADNVAVALCDIKKGDNVFGITALEDIPKAHKILLCDLKEGENIVKYGYPIGHIVCDTLKGSYIHEHNLKTNLTDSFEYNFGGDCEYEPQKSDTKINAYKRADGKIGIRNEIWIIPTVGCANKACEQIALKSKKLGLEHCDGVFAYTHPFGCSQLEEDMTNTQKVLSGIVKHPNAGGVLVVSLGCENNNLNVFKSALGSVDKNRVKFLCLQEADDEIADGVKLVEEIYSTIKHDKREEVGIDNLVVGYKCGGSDAFSGITANPLCGKVNDLLVNAGASAILTEVPEMFGAEQILMTRAKNREVFVKTVNMINGFKDYFSSNGVVCYENPSPGNHEGGITTLEEKSLGCVQKGGTAVVTDVLSYAEPCKKRGLNLLYGPGNDIVSVTNLTAAGAHIILFTTGRGTPLGAPVPTIKISSNSDLYRKKPNWVDFNAGVLLESGDLAKSSKELLNLIITTANGEKTKNEVNGYKEISIFKNGVIM